MAKNKNIVAYVMSIPPSVQGSIDSYEKKSGKKLRIMLIRDSRFPAPEQLPEHDLMVQCDFSKPEKIAAMLLPYQDELLAITCRGDNNIGKFAQIIPNVPYLRTPTTESLQWATDKYEMRKRFQLFDKKITPKFTWVKENSKKERARVIDKIAFPLIIKPTNLGGSLFVSICYHEEELEKTLRTLFRKIKAAYANDKRTEQPKIIAEEYMEGDLYSLDSYVDSRGQVYHCPLVRQKTGKEIGHDDFYNYLQMTPAALKKTTIDRARNVAETAIHALGLRSTTTHTELMKIDDDWKVVEIGPRCGGFRDTLHQLSCDINHSLNDIFIRIPKKPVIPKKCKGYAAAIKWFSPKEGKIIEMKGIKKIEEFESFHHMVLNKKIGDRAIFARNGGRSIFNLFLYNADRSKLLADIRRIEQLVKIRVQTRNGAKLAAQKQTKTSAKKK